MLKRRHQNSRKGDDAIRLPAPGWHAQRFQERDTAVHTNCAECGRDMWLPASKLDEYKRCSRECNSAYKAKIKADRSRSCRTCGATFTPRPVQLRNGHGVFCSQACNVSARDALQTPEAKAKAVTQAALLRADGGFNYRRGPDNHKWTGGKEAQRARRALLQANGTLAARLKDYRARNPHKVHEFVKRRSGREIGRLEYGTIPRIGAAQKWKCAICCTPIKAGYHVDHITPLARGGEHAARNIQLLCGTCNVRKAAKDPIEYMQSLGRLL